MEYQYILLAIVSLAIISIFVLIKFSSRKSSTWKLKIQSELVKLNQLIQNGDEISLKSALMEIDKLFDHAMKSRFIKGETLGERLKNAEKHFERKFYNQIWEAHKLRNRLAHEVGVRIDTSELKKAYDTLNRAIAKLSR